MPDLAFFASSGFPFSRVADLSETVVLIPQQPSPDTLQALFTLIGRIGDSTGAPAVGVTIARPGESPTLRGRDVLVVGPLSLASQASELFQSAPVRVEGSQLRVSSNSPISRLFSRFGSNVDQRDPAAADAALVTVSDFAGVSSWRSPFDKSRVVVAVLAATPSRLPEIVNSMAKAEANAAMQGDLAIATDKSFNSFQVAPGFWSGHLPWWVAVMWWCSRNPLLLALAVIGASLIIGAGFWVVLRALERKRCPTGKWTAMKTIAFISLASSLMASTAIAQVQPRLPSDKPAAQPLVPWGQDAQARVGRARSGSRGQPGRGRAGITDCP